jgi:alkylhydroperoxidase family enzyme
MARIPYGDPATDPEITALAEEIRKQRGGRLPNLYRMLLNSPPIASGWLNLLTAVRQQCSLAGRYREMAIIRVAIINHAQYEYKAHIPFALQEGMNQTEIDALSNWESSNVFGAAERAVLAYTDSMTRNIQVSDDVFADVARHFGPRELTELTATIATYNLVSRFLEAVQIDPEN